MEIVVYVTVPVAIFSLAQLFAIATKNFVTLPPAILLAIMQHYICFVFIKADIFIYRQIS